jgi:hypothetical protein
MEFGCDREFVFEPPDTLRRRLISRKHHCQNWHWVAALSAAVKSEVRALAERL